MLPHDAVAATVSHRHHSIIRDGVGLIQFVYGSHSRLATELIHQRILFSPWFSWAFSWTFLCLYTCGFKMRLKWRDCRFVTVTVLAIAVYHRSGRITSDFTAPVTIVLNPIFRSIVYQSIQERLHSDFVLVQLWVATTISRPSEFCVGGAKIHLRYTFSNIEFTQIMF